MQILSIKDLSLNEEMDSNDMAAIVGGIVTTNIAALNLGLIAHQTGNGITHNPPPSGGVVSGGDPGSGGGSGGGGYLDGFEGDDDHRPD